MDTIIAGIMKFAGMFSPATWFLMISIIVFIMAIIRASLSKTSKLDWEDMLVDQLTQKMSVTRLGQLVGIIIGSWVIITIVDAKKEIGIEVFGTYLAFLIGAYGLNNYFKNGSGGQPLPPPDKVQKTKDEE